MHSIPRQDVPVAIAAGGVEVRVLDQDGIMAGFVALPPAPTCARPGLTTSFHAGPGGT
jgi:hypothetical protein